MSIFEILFKMEVTCIRYRLARDLETPRHNQRVDFDAFN